MSCVCVCVGGYSNVPGAGVRQTLVILWDCVCGAHPRGCKLVSGIAEPKVEPGQMDGQNQQVCCLQQSRVVRVDDVSGLKGGEGGGGQL